MWGVNYFVFGGIKSEDYGVIMTAPPTEIYPERDAEAVSIPGRSGDVILDNGRYKNTRRTFQCAIIPKEWGSMRDAVGAFIAKLKQETGYAKLTDTYNEGIFRLASVTAEIGVESIVEQIGTFSIEFNCKPQHFYDYGQEQMTLEKHTIVYNSHGYSAKPLIIVYGTGPGALTVGNVTVEIKALEDQITLDCDQMNAYRQVGDAPAENKNSKVLAWEFPELLPGNNAVSWSGGISKIEIVPRWWTL